MPGGLTGPELGLRCGLGLAAYVVLAVAVGLRWPGARRFLLRAAGVILCAAGFLGMGFAVVVLGGGGFVWVVVWVFTIGYVHADDVVGAYARIAGVGAAAGVVTASIGALLATAGGASRRPRRDAGTVPAA